MSHFLIWKCSILCTGSMFTKKETFCFSSCSVRSSNIQAGVAHTTRWWVPIHCNNRLPPKNASVFGICTFEPLIKSMIIIIWAFRQLIWGHGVLQSIECLNSTVGVIALIQYSSCEHPLSQLSCDIASSWFVVARDWQLLLAQVTGKVNPHHIPAFTAAYYSTILS